MIVIIVKGGEGSQTTYKSYQSQFLTSSVYAYRAGCDHPTPGIQVSIARGPSGPGIPAQPGSGVCRYEDVEGGRGVPEESTGAVPGREGGHGETGCSASKHEEGRSLALDIYCRDVYTSLHVAFDSALLRYRV